MDLFVQPLTRERLLDDSPTVQRPKTVGREIVPGGRTSRPHILMPRRRRQLSFRGQPLIGNVRLQRSLRLPWLGHRQSQQLMLPAHHAWLETSRPIAGDDARVLCESGWRDLKPRPLDAQALSGRVLLGCTVPPPTVLWAFGFVPCRQISMVSWSTQASRRHDDAWTR
jgi:hypothetical protein